MAEQVGTIEALWRFPVKSMQGEQLDATEVSASGLAGDRAYALIDATTGKVVSAKNPRLWPNILNCHARFLKPPRIGEEPPPVLITLANGTSVTSDASDVDTVLSTFFARKVLLARTAPVDLTIDQYHPDVADLDPAGHRDMMVEARIGSAFFAEEGLPSPVSDSAFFDLFPLSVLTTSTLERLRELAPASAIDERRFRMNVIVAATGSGFIENSWLDRRLTVGDVDIDVKLPDPRCVMTTLAQQDLPPDSTVLRTLVKHNRLDVGGGGLYPCAGMYAVIASPGTIRCGDRITIS
ncbi:MAG: MOSC domain-containing protein [Pseudonocardia sp.]|nr:MOSC domain-containing protein [Pseudonocardia sp.]